MPPWTLSSARVNANKANRKDSHVPHSHPLTLELANWEPESHLCCSLIPFVEFFYSNVRFEEVFFQLAKMQSLNFLRQIGSLMLLSVFSFMHVNEEESSHTPARDHALKSART